MKPEAPRCAGIHSAGSTLTEGREIRIRKRATAHDKELNGNNLGRRVNPLTRKPRTLGSPSLGEIIGGGPGNPSSHKQRRGETLDIVRPKMRAGRRVFECVPKTNNHKAT